MTLHEFGESFAHSGIHRELVNILKEIRVISDKIRSEDDAASIENDWKFAAMVLDRICLITFSLFTVVATVAVLAAAPHVIVKWSEAIKILFRNVTCFQFTEFLFIVKWWSYQVVQTYLQSS